MLTITVLGEENWDESSNKFTYPYAFELQLEHSLVSLSKWESEFEKPFLGPAQKTDEETLGYLYHMVLTPGFVRDAVYMFSSENINAINDYINKKSTATWFNDTRPEPKNKEIITSELIYYWMTMFHIPIEAENWHLNRLFTLIKVAGLKNQKPKKMTREEQMARHAEMRRLNEERKKQLGSNG